MPQKGLEGLGLSGVLCGMQRRVKALLILVLADDFLFNFACIDILSLQGVTLMPRCTLHSACIVSESAMAGWMDGRRVMVEHFKL